MTAPDHWDDDRLAAAFAARDANVQVPPELTTETLVALRRRPTRNDAPWWRPLPIAAAAALIVSMVGLSLAMSWRTASPPAPTVPSVVQGLPVVDVREAIEVQGVAGDDRELAVHGWLSTAPPMSCVPSDRPVSPLAPFCHSELNWLLQDPEALVVRNGSDIAIVEPVGPAVHPSFAYGAGFSPPHDMPPVTETLDPWPIVAIGHFDDRMAAACAPAVRDICEDRFVIDRLAWIAGVSDQIVYEVRDEKVRTQPDEIVEILSSLLPASPVLSLRVVPGRGLTEFDPTLPHVSERLRDESRVWVIRVLDGERAKSVYVTDDDHEVFVLGDSDNLVPIGELPQQTVPA